MLNPYQPQTDRWNRPALRKPLQDHRGDSVETRGDILANAEDNRVRVVLIAPPGVLRLKHRRRRGDAHGSSPLDHSRAHGSGRRERRAGGDERDEEGDDLHDGNLTQETRTHNAP